jgi:hypothetical protein
MTMCCSALVWIRHFLILRKQRLGLPYTEIRRSTTGESSPTVALAGLHLVRRGNYHNVP